MACATGMQVLEAIQGDPCAARRGAIRSSPRGAAGAWPEVTLGGRVAVPRLRVRSDDGEEPLPSFRWARPRRHAGAVAAGVSMRVDSGRGGGAGDVEHAVKVGQAPAVVSQPAVGRAGPRVAAWTARSSGTIAWWSGDHTQGRARAGTAEGATETAVVTSGLLAIWSRGLPTDRTLPSRRAAAPAHHRCLRFPQRWYTSCAVLGICPNGCTRSARRCGMPGLVNPRRGLKPFTGARPPWRGGAAGDLTCRLGRRPYSAHDEHREHGQR